MDDSYRSSILCKLLNYTRFRITASLQGESKIDNKLKLFRVLFAMKSERGWKKPFEKLFKSALKKMGMRCSQSDVENSIMNYHYRISDDGTFVILMFAEQNPVGTLNITEHQLCVLHEKCENIIMKLVEDHCKSHKRKSEDHCESCEKCFNKERLKKVIHASKPTVPPTQERKAASEFITLSLCDNPAADESNSRNSLGQQSDDKATESEKQPSEAEKESRKNDNDERENKEDGDVDKHPAPVQCSQESDEKAESTKQPSEAADGSSKSNGNKLTNLKDGDDKKEERSESDGDKLKNLEGGDDKMPSSSHNSKAGTFRKHKEERLKAATADKDFWEINKYKIKDEIEKREDKPKYVLTYFDRSQKEPMYELFVGEQEALTWAYTNSALMEESYPFIRIREVLLLAEKRKTKRKICAKTTKDLMNVTIELLGPSTATGKVVCKKTGMFDTGSDIASFPNKPEIFKSLMNSVTELNGKLVPIVYAKLVINGEELKKIYKIEVESDEDWCAIGIPQMQDSSPATACGIIQRIGQKIF